MYIINLLKIICINIQDLLDADKQYRDNDATPTNDGGRSVVTTAVQETRDLFSDFTCKYPAMRMGSFNFTLIYLERNALFALFCSLILI